MQWPKMFINKYSKILIIVILIIFSTYAPFWLLYTYNSPPKPTSFDTDGDGISNYLEIKRGSDSNSSNSPLMPWAIAMHLSEIKITNDDWNETNNSFYSALDKIERLGVYYIRSDFILEDLIYENGTLKTHIIQRYKWMVNYSYDRGIGFIVILNIRDEGSDASWMYEKYHEKDVKNEFWDFWAMYCEMIGREFGDKVDYYQMLNEENNVNPDPMGYSLSKLELKDEYKAFEIADKNLAKGDNNYRTIVNAIIVPGWRIRLSLWCINAGDYIDVLAIDWYPGTDYKPLTTPDDWRQLKTLIRIMNLYDKDGAIMETGWPGSDEKQVKFVSQALSEVREIVSENNNNPKNQRILMGCWYELKDGGSRFGAVDSTYQEKMVFEELTSQIEEFE